ncbi:Toxin-antitoxin system, toxin component, PIN family [Candidatus Promineifilum breve]|uniref:Toxin-antitoxin system, toxin component, PIN family n=1 Tax=Candidatus Promineifilum breve TaxID=1806508 RepID=A0A161JMY6_9CHLR|nr:type II toxin-antitoxin system VapC family toxin [Candidatus Promineifilum breve]CUS06303.1 Toxin-antitoxin system, toxin component, PIN family [Candidatus Promineifilum breve]
MRLLLDTHALLWLLDDRALSTVAQTVFLDPENELFFSVASYWEICIKVSLGKLNIGDDWINQIDEELAINGITWLPIEKSHCLELMALPRPAQVAGHRDPFDRLLIAQARAEGLSVLSADPNFGRYDVAVLW